MCLVSHPFSRNAKAMRGVQRLACCGVACYGPLQDLQDRGQTKTSKQNVLEKNLLRMTELVAYLMLFKKKTLSIKSSN